MTRHFPITLLVLCLAAPLQAQIFGEQSARAAGVAGAFAAQVDDPSAVWYNPGALGLMKKKKGATVGASYTRRNEELFQGFTPGIAQGSAAQQTKANTTLAYGFGSVPLGAHLVSGVGIYSPLRIDSEWAAPAQYAGRFLATRSQIKALDTAAVFALSGSSVGIGGGAIMRTSSIATSRHIASSIGGLQQDAGTIDIKTDDTRSYGWTAGLAVRPSTAFSLGLTYRSRIRTDYNGAASLTQIPTGNAQLDQLIAASLPFGEKIGVQSTLEFPAQATAGIAFAAGQPLLIEIDATQTDWSHTSSLPLAIPTFTALSASVPLDLKKTTDLRAGLRFTFPTGPQVRLGYAILDSPQPDATVGAFLATAKRSMITAGFGLDWLDFAVAWTQQNERNVTNNVDQLNGRYRGNGWAVLMSVTK
jgi:long-chain fatty acid transport protein